MALRGLKITWVCNAILFISCSIILSFKFKHRTLFLFPKHFSFCFYVLGNWCYSKKTSNVFRGTGYRAIDLSVKSCFQASFTSIMSYINTTKRSSSDNESSLTSLGMHKSSSKASVTSGNTFKISQAVFFPLPANEDTVSHPVRTVCMATVLISCTTSVRVSASSCEHGARLVKSDSAGKHRTSVPHVAYISLPSAIGRRMASRDRTPKISVLFWSTRRKSFQFLGMTVEGATLFLKPLSLFCLVVPFR